MQLKPRRNIREKLARVSAGLLAATVPIAAGRAAMENNWSVHYNQLFETLRDRPAALLRNPGFLHPGAPPGGLVDVEFAAQTLQILGAPRGGQLTPSTVGALRAAAEEGRLSRRAARVLIESWHLHQAVAQTLKLALRDGVRPDMEPDGFQALLARAGGVDSLSKLEVVLQTARTRAEAVCRRVYGSAETAIAQKTGS